MAETTLSDPENLHSGFSSLVHSLLPKDNIFKDILTLNTNICCAVFCVLSVLQSSRWGRESWLLDFYCLCACVVVHFLIILSAFLKLNTTSV